MKRNILLSILGTILCAALALTAGCGNSSQAAAKQDAATNDGQKVVRIAVQPGTIFAPLYIAREKGWLEEALKDKNVKVEWTDFEAGPPMNESFSAGQQDIGVLGDVPAVSALAAGQDNTFIADINGGESYAVLVKPDSSITKPADLKGKKIGLVVGSTCQNFVEKLLKKNGISINDVKLVNISVGDSQTVLTNGDVDAVAIWDPTVTRLEDNKSGKIIATGKDAGILGVNVIFARSQFVKDNPEIVKVVLEQYYRGAKEWQAHPEKYGTVLQKYFKVDPRLFPTIAKKYDYKSTFDDQDINALKDTVIFLQSIQAIQGDVDIKSHVNNDLITQVLQGNK